MTYRRFEDTPAWQAAVALGHGVYALVKDRAFDGQGDLRSQLQRASLSASNNIAEGFERGTTPELISFLYVARGSAGEVRSALRFAAGLDDVRHLRRAIDPLIAQAESVSRQLHGWTSSLQNGDIKGQRHATDASLAAYQQRQRGEAFLKMLQERHPPKPIAADDKTDV